MNNDRQSKLEFMEFCGILADQLFVVCGFLRNESHDDGQPNVSTTMAHYVKDVPEATRRGMEQLEELCSEREVALARNFKSN